MTDKEFKEQALIFFYKYSNYYDRTYPINIESDALDYVRKGNTFKYKDPVEAGVIVNCLTDLGYVEFVKRENDIRYHLLTKSGLE